MTGLFLTRNATPILSQFAAILGWIINGIFNFLDSAGIPNVGLTVVIFTVIIYTLMLPLTYKQQKFSRMSVRMNPELQAIQKKYKGKQDQASMQKMQMEQQAVYEKYGATPTGGCLSTIIQLPIMFALYQVIYNIPAYIGGIKDILMRVVEPVMSQPGYVDKLAELAKANNVSAESLENVNKMVDLFGKFNAAAWDQLKEIFPALEKVITEASGQFLHINSFLGGMNLTEAPGFRLSIALIIPILAGLTQWLSVKITTTTPMDPDAPGASTMKTMNVVMPLISVFFCISFPIGVGLYWVASSTVRMILQLGINQYMKKVDVDDMIKANIEKKNKKRAKRGLPAINADATIKSANKNAAAAAKKKELEASREKKEKTNSTDYYKQKRENMGTIASRARMVQDFDEKKAKK